MDKKIKISADWSSVKRGLDDLMQSIKTLSSSQKISLFDNKTMEALKAGSTSAQKYLQLRKESLGKRSNVVTDALKKENLLESEKLKLNTRLIQLKKEELHLTKLLVDSQKNGGMGGGVGGLGVAGVAGPIGAAIGMAVGTMMKAGLGKIVEGSSQFTQGINSRILLRRRGVGGYQGYNPLMSSLGMHPEEIRQAQLQSTNIFGKTGAEPQEVGKRALFARMTGQNLNDMQGLGAGFRQAVGITAAQRMFVQLEGSVLSDHITDAIGPYLQTAADMLTKLNDDGFTLDASALTALTTVMKATGYSPERSEKMLMNLDSTIKKSSGENAAFFQQALANAGMGGGTLGGTKFVSQVGGLMGSDINKAKKGLSKADLAEVEKTGVFNPNYLQNLAKSLVRTMGQLNLSTVQKGMFLQNMGFGRNPLESLQMNNLLEQISATKNPQRRKVLESELQKEMDKGKNKEERLADVMGKNTQALESLGERAFPVLIQAIDEQVNITRGAATALDAIGMAVNKDYKGMRLTNEGYRKDATKGLGKEDINSELYKVGDGLDKLVDVLGQYLPGVKNVLDAVTVTEKNIANNLETAAAYYRQKMLEIKKHFGPVGNRSRNKEAVGVNH